MPHVRTRRIVDGFVRGQEIPLAKRVQVTAVEGEKPEFSVKGIEFVEIEGEEENAVEKAVAPRRESLVHDVALVEAGVHLRCYG